MDFRGKSVLITGGTRGLGKAIGLEFGLAGATVFLTHRWGSADEAALVAEFTTQGLAAPYIIESDVADEDAIYSLMKTIQHTCGRLDMLVSNVAFSKVIHDLTDLKQNALMLSLGYSAWPLVELIQATHEVLGAYPRYVVAISSDGSEVCHDGYDLAGASKAVLETLCRYLALRLKRYGVRVNALRPGFLDTASSRATFGDERIEAAKEKVEGLFLDPNHVATSCVALCCGLLDAVTGQVLVVDEGWSLVSPISFLTGQGLPGQFPIVQEAHHGD
jgi:NAD(P)-dependent dehydrogenase (short-subunit alcohol dehydrogenase family)